MLIESIELFRVAVPLKKPLPVGAHAYPHFETVLVRMQSGQAIGWGEASPGNGPLAASEYAGGVFQVLQNWFAPALVGQIVSSGDDLQERLEPFQGNRYAKAALDTAWWDLDAKLKERPLHELLGGKRDRIELGIGFDRMDTIDPFLEAVSAAAEQGYSRIELKFRPGWDFQVLGLVRQELPTHRLHIDAEGSMRLDHMELFCRLDDFHLEMAEQLLPADDLIGHAMIQETIHTPLSLDESITTPARAETALELKSCRYINVKPGQVGGLTPAVEIHDTCLEEKIPCWVGANPQTAIGIRAGLALATKENFTYPTDDFLGETWFETDVAEPIEKTLADGVLGTKLWTEPGIGIEPDKDWLEKYTVDHVKL